MRRRPLILASALSLLLIASALLRTVNRLSSPRPPTFANVTMSDPRLGEFDDMLSVDRTSLGLPPLPRHDDIWVERHEGGSYDVMLHFYAEPQRTVAFRRQDGKLKWVHEQVIVKGPGQHTTPDGTYRETLTFTYETVPVAGGRLNHLNILYTGPDFHLYMKDDLTADDVKPILDQWMRRR